MRRRYCSTTAATKYSSRPEKSQHAGQLGCTGGTNPDLAGAQPINLTLVKAVPPVQRIEQPNGAAVACQSPVSVASSTSPIAHS